MESKLEIKENGDKFWRLPSTLLHREDGSSIIGSLGGMNWYIEGKLHRENGPALELQNGYKEWYLNGIQYKNEQEWKKEIRKRKLKKLKI